MVDYEWTHAWSLLYFECRNCFRRLPRGLSDRPAAVEHTDWVGGTDEAHW